MSTDPRPHGQSPLASLRRFLRPRAARERCALCSAELPEDHDHLVELSARRLLCACQACAILFTSPAAAKYRRVPRRAEYLPDFRLTDVQWEALDLPINLAFFLHNSAMGRVVALYPSPAGATEALPPPDAWEAVVEDNPSLRDLEPDIEALLVNRLADPPEHYRAGIDQCYALVGLVRKHWQGISGGRAVWEEVGRFFSALKERSRPGGARHHA